MSASSSSSYRPRPLQRSAGEEPLFVMEALGELAPGAVVVDAGAKTGSFPYAAFPQLRILSLDLEIPGTPTKLPHVQRARGNLLSLPVADASVDLLVCYYVLEHVRRVDRAVAEAARVVKPGGLLFAAVPESSRFDDRFYRFAGWTAKNLLGRVNKHPQHHGLTGLAAMMRWLYGAGFRVRSFAELPAGFSWMNDPRTQKLQWGFVSALYELGRLGVDCVSRSNVMLLAERSGRSGYRHITHTCRRCGYFVDADPTVLEATWTCPYCATTNRLHQTGRSS